MVGGENDEGIPVAVRSAESVEQVPGRTIQILNHRGEDGTVDLGIGTGPRRVACDKGGGSELRAMHGVVREHTEKWLRALARDKFDRAPRERVDVVRIGFRVGVGRGFARDEHFVETLRFGVHRPAGLVIVVGGKMPFPEMRGRVAARFQGVTERDRRNGQTALPRRGEQRWIGDQRTRNKICEMESSGVQARVEARARR